MRRRGLLLITTMLVACKAGRIERPDESQLQGLPPGKVALLNPRGQPEQLLGLPVETVEGQFVIADARRPGCEVAWREIPTQWESQFHEDIGRTGGFDINWLEIAELRGKYGKSLRVESRVSNLRELRADLRGPCGENVITSVLVGTGWRELQYAKQIEGRAGVEIYEVEVGGGGAGWDRVGGRFEWTEPQAWAFGLGDGGSESADITIVMPARLEAGEQFTPEIQVGRSLWLIVLYRDAEGNYGLVFPSPELPSYQVAPGGRVELPAMVASILPGHTSDFETLIVYGFAEAGDYKQFAPPAGALSPAQVNEYAQGLEQRIQDPNTIPRARWTSTTYGYEVVAAPAQEP